MSTATTRRSLASSAFHGAAAVLRSTVQERVARRLTPPAPAPRDSDPTIGDPLPEAGGDALPPPPSAWAWADADSDDGGTRR